jgi:hypothetical protein
MRSKRCCAAACCTDNVEKAAQLVTLDQPSVPVVAGIISDSPIDVADAGHVSLNFLPNNRSIGRVREKDHSPAKLLFNVPTGSREEEFLPPPDPFPAMHSNS